MQVVQYEKNIYMWNELLLMCTLFVSQRPVTSRRKIKQVRGYDKVQERMSLSSLDIATVTYQR